LQYYVEPPSREKPGQAEIIHSKVSSLKAPPSAMTNLASEPVRNVERQPMKPVNPTLLSKRLRAPSKDKEQAAFEQPALRASPPASSAKDTAPKPVEEVAVASSAETAATSDYSAGPEANATTALLPMNRNASEKTKRALATPRMKLAMADAIISPAVAKNSAGPAVLWSINTSPETLSKSLGVVQRSRDRGKTWEVIPLNDRVSFRAVTASGNDVWAGGSNGALFHSSDGGSHWVQIAISEEAAKPTGAIVSIDARDPNQLRIATSSGEQWITTDGGWHWRQE
jgi:hypothetical protein